jgi:autotransporter family porin
MLKPYLKANIWHAFSATDTLTFGADPIKTELGGTSLELGGGVTYDFSTSVCAIATVSDTFDINGDYTQIVAGNVGLRLKW